MTEAIVSTAAVPVRELGGAWTPAPAVLTAAVLALALFFQGFVRLRRRGRTDHAGWGHALLFVAGVAVIVLALLSPLDAIGEGYLLSAHMLQHVLISDVGPALILLALCGPLLYFFLPRPALVSIAGNRRARTFLRRLTNPFLAVAVWCTVLAVWHVPFLYDAALTSQWLHDLEHASFLLAGFLIWYQLLDPTGHGLRRSGRLGLVVALFAAGQILTMVLVFSFEPLYPAYAAQPERLLGFEPITDQRLAGVVMMIDQVLMLGALAAVLLLGADRERTRPDEVPVDEPRLTTGPHA